MCLFLDAFSRSIALIEWVLFKICGCLEAIPISVVFTEWRRVLTGHSSSEFIFAVMLGFLKNFHMSVYFCTVFFFSWLNKAVTILNETKNCGSSVMILKVWECLRGWVPLLSWGRLYCMCSCTISSGWKKLLPIRQTLDSKSHTTSFYLTYWSCPYKLHSVACGLPTSQQLKHKHVCLVR